MKLKYLFLICAFAGLCSCNFLQKIPVVFESENLKIQKLNPHTYMHVSYLTFTTFGRVACNGMVYVRDGEAMIFDTPTDDEVANELIEWVEQDLEAKVVGIVVHHFHVDCLGGLNAFHARNIPSYANQKTIDLAIQDGVEVPQQAIDFSGNLSVGGHPVECRFFGEGHTLDNIVTYLPDESILFGGCLIKSVGASKGNLADANTAAWSSTVENIKTAYPGLKQIIPGHGFPGDEALLNYTITLFE